MTNNAIECGRTIDKFIGDAAIIFFGDPESKGERKDALSCIQMAV
jgi:class 3 adenylate cyclase